MAVGNGKNPKLAHRQGNDLSNVISWPVKHGLEPQGISEESVSVRFDAMNRNHRTTG